MARNFIDRCFEAVAPVHAVRRSAARTASASQPYSSPKFKSTRRVGSAV